MKFQPKRFVVEVKRGTSRAAFSSPDAGPDKFSSAEAMLFGTPRKDETAPPPRKSRAGDEAPRRILESLVEPPAPEPVIEEEVERPRRGRKPGSKNKPKLAAVPEAAAPPPQLSAAALAFMTPPEPPRPVAQPMAVSDDVDDEPPAAAEERPAEAALAVVAEQNRRPRLRDRSSIIKRYVLGIEPQPGQTGSLRARRQARTAR